LREKISQESRDERSAKNNRKKRTPNIALSRIACPHPASCLLHLILHRSLTLIPKNDSIGNQQAENNHPENHKAGPAMPTGEESERMSNPAGEASENIVVERKKKFALLVDGYVRDLFTTGLILQRLGYDVYIATTGEGALKIIDSALPLLLVTELALPHMSGLELIVRLKHDSRAKSVPIIVQTAIDDPKREELCRASGCSLFLKKPVDPSTLYSAIQQATEALPRKHIRVQTLLPVRVGGLSASSDQNSTEYISSLSENGIFVRTLTPRPVGAVLPVTLIIHSIPIKLKAAVLRSTTMKLGLFKEPGMAMKFTEIAETDRELLRNFIRGQLMKDIPTQ